MNALEISILVISILAALMLLYLFVGSEVVYRLTLKRDNLSVRLINEVTYRRIKKYAFDFSWWNNFFVKKVEIKSHDGLTLCGKIIENDTKKFAIIVHGYGARSSEMQQYAKMFNDFGFSVLAPDNRAHGDSDGKFITMGYEDKFDVLSWVHFLEEKYQGSQIVVLGLSMGAATVCMLSGLRLPNCVKAIISDCAYSNAYKAVRNVQQRSVIFSLFPLKFFDFYLRFRKGFKLSDADAISAVKKTKVPILFVHGDKDWFVPFSMQDELYGSTKSELRDKLVVHGAGHAESIIVGKKEYIEKVHAFVDSYIDG